MNFIGEPAVDAGGPSREFFQLFLQEFARKLMISCPNGSKIFDHNVPSLQVNSYIIPSVILQAIKNWQD